MRRNQFSLPAFAQLEDADANPERLQERIRLLDEQILHRLNALQRLSRRGCDALGLLGEYVERGRELTAKYDSDPLGVLRDPVALQMLCLFDEAQDQRHRVPLTTMLHARRGLQFALQLVQE